MGGRQGHVATWTIAEAAAWLDPPIEEERLHWIIRALRIQPVRMSRPQARRGRPVDHYAVAEIIDLHRAVMRWLV